MTIRAEWIESLKSEIAEIRMHHLTPLEDDALFIGRRGCGEQVEGITQREIASLRAALGWMQAIVDRYEEEHAKF